MHHLFNLRSVNLLFIIFPSAFRESPLATGNSYLCLVMQGREVIKLEFQSSLHTTSHFLHHLPQPVIFFVTSPSQSLPLSPYPNSHFLHHLTRPVTFFVTSHSQSLSSSPNLSSHFFRSLLSNPC